jgi:TonB family protein
MAIPIKSLHQIIRTLSTMNITLRPCAKFLLVALVLIVHSHVSYALVNVRPRRSTDIKAADDDQEKEKEFSPSEGGFSVLLPKEPTESFSTVKIDETFVTTRTYKVRDANAYEISYVDVPHNPDDPKIRAYLLAGLRNYVLEKLKGTLVTDAPLWLNNNEGRVLEISIPKRGVARAIIIVTETRLFRITVVPEKPVENTSNDAADSAALRFLKSFKLLAPDSSRGGEVDAYLRMNPELAKRAFGVTSDVMFLNGQALIGRALKGRAVVPIPEFPEPARMARISGTVIVNIVIDEAGNVIAAQAIAGHPTLQLYAVKAARQARFTPTEEQGRPIKVLGQVTYNFVWR